MTYVAAAFPSACGKTNFAMMIPPKRFAGWKIWTVGDDIAWMRPGKDGRLWAINPENGYFGVVPGHQRPVQPERDEDDVEGHHLHERGHDQGRRRLVGGEGRRAARGSDRLARTPLEEGLDREGRAPQLRFTAPVANNPVLSPFVNDPQGVPISAIIFGGRRANTVPLVMQSFNWAHGVFIGATIGSETTAAATGQVGVVRRDPMAMLPFCRLRHGDLLRPLARHAERASRTRPRSSWSTGSGRGRTASSSGRGSARTCACSSGSSTAPTAASAARRRSLGWVPKAGDLDLSGLDIPHEAVDEATSIDLDEWLEELEGGEKFFKGLGSTVPVELELTRQFLLARVKRVARVSRGG